MNVLVSLLEPETDDPFNIYTCYLPATRSVLGKTVPEVLSTARGRRPRAVLKTEGTVFPNTDQPRPANNVFIFFFRRVLLSLIHI